MRPIKVLDVIYYLLNRIYPRPEVGANSRLAKVYFLKSGPAMGSVAPGSRIGIWCIIPQSSRSILLLRATDSTKDQSPLSAQKGAFVC